uniref:Uncharacterized protein n=1 Tax=Rhizophora mucronata TaxID=61149 RepID=A0A2P2MXY9_RHIMU
MFYNPTMIPSVQKAISFPFFFLLFFLLSDHKPNILNHVLYPAFFLSQHAAQ